MLAVTLVVDATGTTSVIVPAGMEYRYCAACPSGAPASWLAIAHNAENIGVARLVPPYTVHSKAGETNGSEIAITPPVKGSASQAMSGSRRYVPGREL